MARVRRKTGAATRMNLEIAGILALGFALLLGIVLVAPPSRTGIVGGALAFALHGAFGAGAGLFVLLVALLAAIVFLEVDVPRMIVSLGGAACLYFLIAEAGLAAAARDGGALGRGLDGALRALLGDVGTAVVLCVGALALTVGISGGSLKHGIGRVGALAATLRRPGRGFSLSALLLEPPVAALPAPGRELPVPLHAVVPPIYDEPLAETDDDDDDDFDDEDAAIAAPARDDAEPEDEPLRVPAIGEYEAPSGLEPVYVLPDIAKIFDPPQAQKVDDADRAHLLEDTLASFGVGAQVTHIQRGPSITRYELRPERGVKISRISALADDLALALAATSVRIEAPIPGKSAVGIEVPNATVSVVAIREILEHIPKGAGALTMALGKDITGKPVFGDLAKMPHLLVAGATGAGKSVCLNGIIASLLVTKTPDELELLMIDPKRVELTTYNGIPHLKNDVITDPSLAAGALAMITREMDQRYERFAKAGVRKIEEYNAKFPGETIPYIVVVIDELADLMLVAPAKVEMLIMRLAQLARATGIHLVVATQRPSVDVITGLIKANIPSRIAFAVSSQVDSRTILDMGGAERLLGRGDMLYLPIDAPKPIRTQGALVTGPEIDALVKWWRVQTSPEGRKAMEITPIRDDDERGGTGADRKIDDLWYDAAAFLLDSRVAKGDPNVGSTAALQARFAIGHPRAVRLMKLLEELGIVGPNEGTKPRAVTIDSPADLERIAERVGRPQQTDLFAE